MKLCDPCGSLNSDNAAACLGCGEASWRRLRVPDEREPVATANDSSLSNGASAIVDGPAVAQGGGRRWRGNR